MLKRALAICAASAIAVLGLGVGQAEAVSTTNCFADPTTNLSTLHVAGDVYVQACVSVNGGTATPGMRITSNGYHQINFNGWLNLNNVHQDNWFGARTGSGWSQTFWGPPVNVALSGSDYAQGQGNIYIDNHLYGYVFSQSIYMG